MIGGGSRGGIPQKVEFWRANFKVGRQILAAKWFRVFIHTFKVLLG